MDESTYNKRRLANLLLAQVDGARLTRAHLERLAALGAVRGGGGTMMETVVASGGGGGAMMGVGTIGLEVGVTVAMRQVPTSLVHVLDPDATPLIRFSLQNHRATTARLKLVTRVVGVSADAIDTIEVPAGKTVAHAQLPMFLLDQIAGVIESRAASVLVRVEDLDAKVEREATYRVVLLPRTTAYLAVLDDTGAAVDLTKYLAAWVTPNAPEVLQLIGSAGIAEARAAGDAAASNARAVGCLRLLQLSKLRVDDHIFPME